MATPTQLDLGSYVPKGLAFSPDASLLLTCTSDDATVLVDAASPALSVGARHPAGAPVYAQAWSPVHAESSYLRSAKDHPIGLWRARPAGGGPPAPALVASYCGYDSKDEVMAARSLAFSTRRDQVIAGYDSLVLMFDVARPGRDAERRPAAGTRKSGTGQRGLLTAIAVNPDCTG